MSDNKLRRRELFFQALFRNGTGYVCVAKRRPTTKTFEEDFFEYPTQLDTMLAVLESWSAGYDLYYCPMLFDSPKRSKENVSFTGCAWSDLDYCNPDKLLVQPTFALETSGGRFQALWCFDHEEAPADAEDISRRIAYYHAEHGADKSGWDLTQLLRVPYSRNYKYAKDGTPPLVEVVIGVSTTYNLQQLQELYPQVAGYETSTLPFPESFPEDADEIIERYKYSLSPAFVILYQQEPESDWSRTLWNLHMLAYEAGMTKEEVFVVARESKCNKYKRDNRQQIYLWREVCRASTNFEKQAAFFRQTSKLDNLLSEEDFNWATNEKCIVDDFMDWGKGVVDAPWQYHGAGGFILLSSLLAGVVRLPTSFGTIIPNLWFMIMADTTLTRKTTAMDLAVDLLIEIDPEVVLATDGSIEGLFSALATRPGRPSLFLRDEFSGLLEMIYKRDYYAGMAEMFTKMHDGKFQKRVLKRETIEVREPVLIIFAGGIKDRILSMLNQEAVSSGFLPRFVFITADVDITKIKPIGPPTVQSVGRRDEIKAALVKVHEHYTAEQTMSINGKKVRRIETRHDATLTTEAWLRYNQLESKMVGQALKSSIPDLLTPTSDRLAKSGLKASVLLAAARRLDDKIVVEEQDIIKAFSYVEEWRNYSLDVINNVGKTSSEREIQRVFKVIKARGQISRSILMQQFHLTSREAEVIFSTLEQRGLITRTRLGRTERFSPIGGPV